MFRHSKITPLKKGINYKDLILKDFDLVLFSSHDTVGSFIECLEKKQVGDGSFSHVGMIITNKTLRFRGLEDDKLYIFESTMSGNLTDGVKNIDNKTWLGSQIRDFDSVIKAYDANPTSAIAIRRIIDNPVDTMDINEVRERMSYLYGKYNHILYTVDIPLLFFAMFPPLRKFRIKRMEDKFMFCSQLVSKIYIEFGILPKECNAADVIPMDFVAQDQDNMVDRSKFDTIQYVRYLN